LDASAIDGEALYAGARGPMITSREHLIHVLTEAAEVEHNLLCSYLYAVFSLKRAGEAGLSERQAEAVEGWRKTILTVALQEMAHLATVNNLLLSVGGAPHFDRPNLPVAPGYHPAGIVVRLTPFDPATLDHFIYLERPEEAPIVDAEGFEPSEAERQPRRAALTPSALDYETIGGLYDSLAEGFERLARSLGEAVLIDPQGRRQLDEETAKLPNVRRVTDLASALAALSWIKEEGEGSSGTSEESHYQRFCSIKREWEALSAEDTEFTPAWPAAHDPVMRKPLPDVERVWITAEPAASYLDLANALYGVMLQVLTQVFTCESRARQASLMRAGVELMEASAAVANGLTRLPASAEHPGVNGGLTFAVPRNLGFRPESDKDRRLFTERVAALLGGAEARLTGVSLEKAQRRLRNALEQLAEAG
jgi:hypothetical protein